MPRRLAAYRSVDETRLLYISRPFDSDEWTLWWSMFAGAVFDCPYKQHDNVEGRGKCYVVRTPGEKSWVWHTNGQATNGSGYWRVSYDTPGDPTTMHVQPSIHIIGYWHGFIEHGVMRTC